MASLPNSIRGYEAVQYCGKDDKFVPETRKTQGADNCRNRGKIINLHVRKQTLAKSDST